MSRMSRATERVSRRYNDVPVVLDGALVVQHDELLRAVLQAGMKTGRLAAPNRASAQKALDEWVEAHREDALTVRVYACLGLQEWKLIRLKNPLPKDAAKQDPGAARYGFDITGAAVDALEKYGRVLDGEEEEQPGQDEWAEFFRSAGNADMTALVNAVIEVNGSTTEQSFGSLLKA